MNKGEIIQITNTQFSHQHGCLVEGHYYDCAEDCECLCGLPMNGNDHSDCPVELRECPDHKFQRGQQMPEEALPQGVVEIKFPPDWRHTAQPSCGCGCSEVDAAEVVGWCFHCTHVYTIFSPEIQDWHLAYDCPRAPAELKQPALASLAKRQMRSDTDRRSIPNARSVTRVELERAPINRYECARN